MDGNQDDLKGYRSLLHGDEPTVQGFSNFDEEIGFIKQYLQQLGNGENSLPNTCIVVRTNQLVKQYISALNQLGIKTQEIKRSQPDNLSNLERRSSNMD